jgi:hypothetical protein
MSEFQTIDIHVKQWHDRTYGNTYFAAQVTLDYALPTQRVVYLPFQYGYGSHAEHVALKALGIDLAWKRDNCARYRAYYQDANRRDVKAWGRDPNNA